jgi:hypothetical protein
MIQQKLKVCNGCNNPKAIWKSDGKNKYCKECWFSIDKPKAPNKISVKMVKTLDEYSKKRTAFLAMHPSCQAKLIGCTVMATDVHHKAGRGENHLKVNTWLAVCRNCHRWIEENPDAAKELGYSETRLN